MKSLRSANWCCAELPSVSGLRRTTSSSATRATRPCSSASSTIRRRRPVSDENELGVGEHTDYGLLTLLRQDDVGGLRDLASAIDGCRRRRCPIRSSAMSATCSSG